VHAFRHGAINRGGSSFDCLPQMCLYFQSDEDMMHGAMDKGFWLQVSRPWPWWWWSSRPLGLRGCRGSVCLHGRLVHGNLGLLPASAAPRGRGAAGFTTRSHAHGRLAGSAAVSCCRDRVVSAGTVPAQSAAPLPLVFAPQDQGPCPWLPCSQ